MNLAKINHGAMFRRKGIVSHFERRFLIPNDEDGDLTHYTPRGDTPCRRWAPDRRFNACKGNLKTSCDFDYAGKMIEMMMLGLVATARGRRLTTTAQAARSPTAPRRRPSSRGNTARAGR